MPAPVSSSSAPHANLKAATTKPRAHPHPGSRKTRVVRRRGRAQGHFDSDEEIEREVGTDSESLIPLRALET
ncbi:hypothetical protein SERLA73DRAFT_132886 [Serpula lacrymans var. lacrymans S7.3]|uniref:Uncharacterized protein n=2 Tax=Serpula lacrymans var. lacrymans TaxID=341189 RepID=F8PPN8_SERL3|nr:uncharacterized protein SERLADRAFT_383111 [Serpula lacrymans var. lacrymans S7.9]EGO02096.1 hypothetical protein SERLA73DRAFT_132886 [Serpula lacrymans var. lacrymans S7.3]EGO27720.1 hypothetical protein SERLADRAFT_383111 [Serpula lacrymans var. lacrymans S7.9]